jgi:hypothetical protein
MVAEICSVGETVAELTACVAAIDEVASASIPTIANVKYFFIKHPPLDLPGLPGPPDGASNAQLSSLDEIASGVPFALSGS